MQQNECYTILRLYGLDAEKIKLSLRLARAAGCQGLQLMESGGEYAVVICCTGENESAARKACLHWQERLCGEFGDAVVGLDQQSLPQTAVQALLQRDLFAVAGSAESARLLGKALAGEAKSERVFDFGNETFSAPAARRIKQLTGENKHRSELGYAAWQAACALRESGAQLAVHCTEHYALLCAGRKAWACPLPQNARGEHRAKAMLDLMRRYALGLHWPDGTIEFAPSRAQKEPDHAGGLGKAAGAHHPPHGRRVRRAAAVLALLALAVMIAAGAYALLHRTPAAPDAKGYGTADFDAAAAAYLQAWRSKEEDVSAWLALPGGQNRLVYADAGAESLRACWVQDTALSPANSVIALESGSAPTADALAEAVHENAGFTLYRPQATLRCKLFAVYYYDEQDGFSPVSYEDLGGEEAFRSFVVNLKARSLFDTGVSVDPGDSFITLLLGQNDTGASLAVTGRVIRPGESAALVTSAIKASENPLYTSAQYAAMGESAPDMATVQTVWNSWYDTRNDPPAQAEAGQSSAEGTDPGLDIDLAELDAKVNSLLAQADSTLKGLTDVAGSGSSVESDVGQGAAGTISNADMSFNDALTNEESKPDLDQDHSTEQTPDSTGSMDGSGTADTPSQIESAEGRTINVTMNGVAQTMDLTECLAMIVQNELGNNQPAEAYKAQAVAAHSWILSQGSYPSVSGISPSSAVRDAVSQVATVVITYNGNVCFTPYCASVSYGTVSCKDVWGVDRAYLQAVESPYDKQYSKNWNTNGASSGTARYSRETVLARVQEKLGIDLSAIEDPNDWFKVLSTNAFGYVNQMQIGNEQSGQTTCSGRWFRENLMIYQSVDGRTLRSCAFTYEYDSDLDCFIFDVYGYGHGVGMSQWGAIGYAYNGWTYDQILTHYYTGVELVSY